MRVDAQRREHPTLAVRAGERDDQPHDGNDGADAPEAQATFETAAFGEAVGIERHDGFGLKSWDKGKIGEASAM
jgi:hypothetical protein